MMEPEVSLSYREFKASLDSTARSHLRREMALELRWKTALSEDLNLVPKHSCWEGAHNGL